MTSRPNGDTKSFVQNNGMFDTIGIDSQMRENIIKNGFVNIELGDDIALEGGPQQPFDGFQVVDIISD